MFCYQCKDAARGCGCIVKGECGKSAPCAILQDFLVKSTLGISVYAARANEMGAFDGDVNDFIQNALIATMTGVNHDVQSIQSLIYQAIGVRGLAKTLYEIGCAQTRTEPYVLTGSWDVTPADDLDTLLEQAELCSIPLRRIREGEDVVNRQELILYGLKGIAKVLQSRKNRPREFRLETRFNELLDFLANSPDDVSQLQKAALETGRLYLEVQETLHDENRPLPKRFETIIDKDNPCGCVTIELNGEEELSDALRFIKAYRSHWLRDCEQKSISEWSVDRIEPFGLNIQFNWTNQESVSFYLAVESMGIDNIHMHPHPAFLKKRETPSKRSYKAVGSREF
ncbi:MAG: hypothetical protein IKS45_04385 [Thermoguttaceae bacterium]|nr:hypothetical protein [Thermoguttaceae bacterium]